MFIKLPDVILNHNVVDAYLVRDNMDGNIT